ncbi:hypothetical protein [Staphylococcus hyicus]|uniref:hypothetical protein n=1 Tax=Staphylococcus hyicus TaxID=1284 RepID=UPI0031334C13
MAKIKPIYKIPMTLKLNWWDTPISLKQGSVGLSKPITFEVIVVACVSFLAWISIVYNMLTNYFGLFYTFIFTISYIMLLALCLKRDRHGSKGYKSFMPIYRYWANYNNRLISTRSSAKSREVEKLKLVIPIENIDEKTGKVEFVDGSVGVVIDIIGNGSRALFVEEKEKIISSFDTFLRQIDLNVSVMVESKQARQDCTEQIFNHENLKNKNTNVEIDQLINSRIDILKNDIETQFKSTHQYIHLRAPDEDRLNTVLEALHRQRGEGMLRYVEVVSGENIYTRYRDFYSIS